MERTVDDVVNEVMAFLIESYQDGKIQVIDESSIVNALNKIAPEFTCKDDILDIIINNLTKGEDNENVSD